MDKTLLMLVDRPIAFHRCFAEIGGSANAGLFLSQAVYWSFRTDDPEGWFWKTREEWKEETYLSRTEQETVRKTLKKAGFIEEKREGLPARLYFRINLNNITKALESIVGRKPANKTAGNPPTGQQETGQPAGGKPAIISETTSETTTETIRESRPASLSGSPSAQEASGEPSPAVPTLPAFDQQANFPATRRLELNHPPHRDPGGGSSPGGKVEAESGTAANGPAPSEDLTVESAGRGLLEELEAMAAGIRVSAERELGPAEVVRSGPLPPQGKPLSATDPVHQLADEFIQLLLKEYGDGLAFFQSRGIDLEASRIGLLHAVVENPERYRKIKDRRLFMRKWLLNERARLPV